MVDDIPEYTPEELAELYEVIFLGCAGNLILFDKKTFSDNDTLRKWFEKQKTLTLYKKKMEQTNNIEKVLYCPGRMLPLLLNTQFGKVAAWRLRNGR